jgi:hypothetical protein
MKKTEVLLLLAIVLGFLIFMTPQEESVDLLILDRQQIQ